MIKEDIISAVSSDTGYSRTMVAAVVDATLTNITFALSQGNKVKFSGFGIFEPTKRAERTGRNPHTGELVPIPARVLPTFKPSENLKTVVAQNNKV